MTRKSGTIFALVITLVVAIIIATALWIALRGNTGQINIVLPNQLKELPEQSTAINLDDVDTLKTVMIDTDNFFEVLTSLEKYQNYSITGNVKLYGTAGDSANYIITQSRMNEYEKTTILRNSSAEETHYLYIKDRCFIWKSSSNQYTEQSTAFMTSDQSVMIPPYDKVSTVQDIEICDYNNEQCLAFTTVSPITQYECRYYISTVYGILLSASIQKDGVKIYQFDATELKINLINVETFKLPDGTIPLF